MISFDHVTFSRANKIILNDINFTIHTNERVAVLGGSGEGKTTILRLMLRLLVPDEGRIFIDGEDITFKPEDKLTNIRRKFSIVFQDGALFDSLTVKENVAFYLREYTKMDEKEIDFRVRELLSVVALEEAINLMPEELSGGMLRRVAIARSLAAQNPKMFLYDEPTSDLDPISVFKIRKLILDLSDENRGFIVVTHEIMDAVKLAQRFMFLKDGKIRFDGSKDELLHSALPDLQTFIGDWREVID